MSRLHAAKRLPLRLRFAWVWLLLLLPVTATAAHREQQWTELGAAVRAWQAPVADVQRVDVQVSEGELALTLQRGAFDRLRVFLTEVPTDVAQRRGEPLDSLMLLTDPHQPGPEWQPTLQHLRSYIVALDHGQFRADVKPPPVPPPPLLVPLTWVLLALSVLALLLAFTRAARALQSPSFWLPLIAGAWLLRALLPHRLVMVYFGFVHVDQAVTLQQLPRYGPATTLLNHALFAVAPAHHMSIQQLHAFLGALTILPLAALVQRIVGPWSARLFAVALALLPVALLDSGSESMLVPALLWWSSGTLLLAEGFETRRPLPLLGSVVLLALAGLARPDCLVMALPTAALLILAQPQPLTWRPLLPGLLVALLVAALWWPDALFLRDRAREDLAAGNLPRLNLSFVRQLPELLARGWLALDYRYWPILLTPLAAIGLALRESRRAALCLWLASLLWAAPMLLDFNETSKLRLHMPSGLLLLMAAVVALDALRHRVPQRALVAILVATAASALVTVPTTFAPQLSDRSEKVLAAAASLARDGRKTVLVVRSYDDDDTLGVHLFWPNYLLEPGDRWMSVRAWQACGRRPDEHALGVIDVRCHAGVPFAPNTDPRIPDLAAPHASCQTLWHAGNGAPLWQEVEANVGERGFAWYLPQAQLPTLTQAVLRL